MYQVVVPKNLAPKELVKVFEGKERVVLPSWDPMVRLSISYFADPLHCFAGFSRLSCIVILPTCISFLLKPQWNYGFAIFTESRHHCRR